ncbi:nicotinate-nucleotide pyrophosphorylase NadC [Methanobrevibacter ruminantium M1]|uniref:Nicotinate-nucleotide pyrophosphorylase [carboxylating] n=1 Tax=Methanobrevibacter ruminantium (strain ATCC 35063 / DSM 1093 / JCM 13430 / OCM 146 / M1) TaxID=634498 RepID=D3E1Q8_METRM|nr:carboxylating nicotinate-nucleotide diphosphorylase [Methanobrevibacter ruminantium]ADC46469.1 nicotinate-nucleotide pyrophosphorylase NadC [Methanobrevibacter ruminantium M1]
MDDIIKFMLEEDEGFGDITSNALIPQDKVFYAKLISKDEGILAGIEIIKEIFLEYGIDILSSKNDGDEIKKGDILLEIEGNARKILLLERTALNLLMRMSGVATKTHRVVSSVKEVNDKVRVAGTRKTAPALQKYDKIAISIGGGDPHRYGLDDMVLIKDNHIAVVGSVKDALRLAKENVSFSKKIEIEVESADDAVIAAENGADIIMFDNMSPKEAQDSLDALIDNDLRNGVLIEISGGITEDNILDYAPLDVDIISLGSLTHQASSLNFSLDMD